MQIALTPQETRALDRVAIERFHLPGLLLMEHASLALADAACRILGPPHRDLKVLGLAGAGNNGGDVLAAARHLHNRGYDVVALLTSPPRPAHGPAGPGAGPGDAALNLGILGPLGVPLEICADPAMAGQRIQEIGEVSLVLDGVLGTGLTGPVREPLLGLIRALAKSPPGPVLAADIPSGLSGLTGAPMPTALEAVETVTFGFAKTGLLTEAARPFVGKLTVADIGLPRAIREDPRAFLSP